MSWSALFTVGVEDMDIAISVVTLLMVFVLLNTQNRDSAALHLKMDATHCRSGV